MRNRYTPDLPDVFVGRDAVEQGLLRPADLRGPSVVRVLQGVYRPAWVPLTHTLQCRAACLILPAPAVITGRSAASVLGARLSQAGDDVQVSVPMGQAGPARRGVRVRATTTALPSRAFEGIRIAHAWRFSYDAVIAAKPHHATAYLDAIARAGLLDVQAFANWLDNCHDQGVQEVRAAAALVDARSESVPESVTRVRLIAAGFCVVPQFRVLHGDRFVARVDLAIPELKIAVEYDGRWHSDQTQRELDNVRLASLRAAGWTIIVVTAETLRVPHRLEAMVSAAVAERSAMLR